MGRQVPPLLRPRLHLPVPHRGPHLLLRTILHLLPRPLRLELPYLLLPPPRRLHPPKSRLSLKHRKQWQ